MTGHHYHLMIISGEDSGDLHAAGLAAAIRNKIPQCRITGIGGEKMAGAGVEIFFPSAKLAVVGIFEVLSRIPDIIRAYLVLRQQLQKENPDLVVLVDFPDFNLKLAAPCIRRRQIPIIYYIGPQVWAWRPGRVRVIQRLVKKILLILPFEEEFYRQRGVEAEYTGNPLVDNFQNFKSLKRTREAPLIALLPGSRPGEIKRLLPVMLAAARQFHRTCPGSRFIIPLAPSVNREDILHRLPAELSITLVKAPLNQALCEVSLALVASGTATLETALAEVPMIVLYRVNRLSYEIGRRLISVDYISLVNLVAGKEIVPELIQDQCRPEIIARKMRSIIGNKETYQGISHELRRIKKILGRAGASDRAAEAVVKLLEKEF